MSDYHSIKGTIKNTRGLYFNNLKKIKYNLQVSKDGNNWTTFAHYDINKPKDIKQVENPYITLGGWWSCSKTGFNCSGTISAKKGKQTDYKYRAISQESIDHKKSEENNKQQMDILKNRIITGLVKCGFSELRLKEVDDFFDHGHNKFNYDDHKYTIHKTESMLKHHLDKTDQEIVDDLTKHLKLDAEKSLCLTHFLNNQTQVYDNTVNFNFQYHILEGGYKTLLGWCGKKGCGLGIGTYPKISGYFKENKENCTWIFVPKDNNVSSHKAINYGDVFTIRSKKNNYYLVTCGGNSCGSSAYVSVTANEYKGPSSVFSGNAQFWKFESLEGKKGPVSIKDKFRIINLYGSTSSLNTCWHYNCGGVNTDGYGVNTAKINSSNYKGVTSKWSLERVSWYSQLAHESKDEAMKSRKIALEKEKELEKKNKKDLEKKEKEEKEKLKREVNDDKDKDKDLKKSDKKLIDDAKMEANEDKDKELEKVLIGGCGGTEWGCCPGSSDVSCIDAKCSNCESDKNKKEGEELHEKLLKKHLNIDLNELKDPKNMKKQTIINVAAVLVVVTLIILIIYALK